MQQSLYSITLHRIC